MLIIFSHFWILESLVQLLFVKVKEVYDVDSPRLAKEQKEILYNALDALNKSAAKIIMVNLERTFENSDDQDELLNSDEDSALEADVAKKYATYLKDIGESDAIHNQVNQESLDLIKSFQELPFLGTTDHASIYFESFVNKLVRHMASQLIIMPDERRLNFECTKSTVWVIRALRTMIGTTHI